MSKREGVFTENITIFFKNTGETGRGFKFERFYKTIFGRLYTCNIYIITIRVSELTPPYICYRFYPIKRFV